MHYFVVLFLVFMLGACSSGGSSKGSTSTPEPASDFTLKFNPGQINENRVIGDLFHAIQLKALFQGKTPSGTIFVIATLDNNLNSLAYGIDETFADIHLFINPALTVGKYEGQISIDLCSDQQCKNRYGPTNKLSYRLNIQNDYPQFTLTNSVTGQQQKSNVLNFNYVMGEDRPTYLLNIGFPGNANSVIFPQKFLDRYQAEKISNGEYRLKIPYYNDQYKSEILNLQFVGENYSRSFSLEINSSLGIPNLPAVSMLSAARNVVGQNNPGEGQMDIYNINSTYCSDPSLSIELNTNQQDDWIRLIPRQNSSCVMTLNYNFSGLNYGFYDAVISLKSKQELVGEVPVTLAYSEQDISATINPVYIDSSTLAADLAREQNFWIAQNGSFTATALSPWIKNLARDDGSSTNFRYTLSIEELKKINTINEKRVSGFVKVQGGTPSTNYKVLSIDFNFNIPTVFDMSPKTASAAVPFDLTVFGKDFFMSLNAVEIIKFKDLNRTIVDSRFNYALPGYTLDDNAGSATFSMPALSVGFYQLNFASIWIDQYPKLLLNVE